MSVVMVEDLKKSHAEYERLLLQEEKKTMC